MSDTVEVVAKAAFRTPSGEIEPGDIIRATRPQVRELIGLDRLEVPNGDGDVVDRAAAAGTKAREKTEAEAAKAARGAEREAKAEARAESAAKPDAA